MFIYNFHILRILISLRLSIDHFVEDGRQRNISFDLWNRYVKTILAYTTYRLYHFIIIDTIMTDNTFVDGIVVYASTTQ